MAEQDYEQSKLKFLTRLHPTPESFTFLICTLIAVYIAASIGLAFVGFEDPTLDRSNAAHSLSRLLAVFGLITWLAYWAGSKELLYFSIFSSLFIIFRPYAYIYSIEYVYFPINNITYEDIRLGTDSYIYFICSMSAPMLLLGRVTRRTHTKRLIADARKRFERRGLLILLASSSAMILFAIGLSNAVYTNPENSHFVLDVGAGRDLSIWIELALSFLNPDEYVILNIVIFALWMTAYGRPNTVVFLFLIGSIVLYIYSMSATGSRSSGIRVAMYFVSVFLVFLFIRMERKRALRISIIMPIFALVSILISIIFLPYANLSRDRLAFFDTNLEDSALNEQGYASNISRMSHSIVFYDYVIIAMTRSPSEDCIDQYLNGEYYLKNVANFILPGQPYPDAAIPTTSLYRVCLGAKDIGDLKRYHSELWTTPGLLRMEFPDHLYASAAVLGIVIALLIITIQIVIPGWIYVFVAPIWLLFIPAFLTYLFAVDHLLALLISQGTRFLIPVLLVASVFLFIERTRLQKLKRLPV